MLELAASEFDLVTMTRAIVGLGDPAPALLRSGRPLAAQSPACAEAMRETLSKGVVLKLARGGWRTQDRVRDGQRVGGRLWDRHPVPTLHFSDRSERMLRWLSVSTLVADPKAFRGKGPKTLADELLFYLAMRAAHDAHCAQAVAKQRPFQQSALCWLAFPDYLALASKKDEPPLPDFDRLADGLALEALEEEIAGRWIAIERSKTSVTSGAEMKRLGGAQARVLDAFFGAISRTGRRDLARFALLAGARLLAAAPASDLWLGSLERNTKLSAREAARRSAAAFLESLETLSGWATAAAGAHFIDDDYAASQIYLEIWETLGSQNLATARSLRTEMTSIEGLLDAPSEGEAT